MRLTASIIIVAATTSILAACSAPQAGNTTQTAQNTSTPEKVYTGSRLKGGAGAQPDVKSGGSIQGAGGW